MKKTSVIRLGVNIDHAATLRQVRGGTTSYPHIPQVAKWAIQGGAQQITIHLREDRRHIQEYDFKNLSQKRSFDLNLEMAATPKMMKMALNYRPDWVCFVPESREELTTEGGLDVDRYRMKLMEMVKELSKKNILSSMFIEPSLQQVEASYLAGADAVEFHTGHWVLLKGRAKKKEWKRLVNAAKLAHELGMKVHAGHGLDYDTTREICRLPYLREVNIGHSLICHSLDGGLKKAVQKMSSLLREYS